MDGFVIGLAVGLGVGIAIGISIGRKQKPWSELTAGERKARIIAISAGVVLLIAGVVLGLILFLS
ncbi:hypothetical protein ACFLVN_01140 [Chloroflexota bacterium]